MILALLLCGGAPALAQTAPPTGARPAAEDDRPGQPGYRAVAVRDECPRRQPAGRQADPDRRGAQLHRVRRSPGAGGRPLSRRDRWRNGRRAMTATRALPRIRRTPPSRCSARTVRGPRCRRRPEDPEARRRPLTFDVDVLEGDLTGATGRALFIDRFGFGGFHAGGFPAGGFRGFHASGFRRGLPRRLFVGASVTLASGTIPTSRAVPGIGELHMQLLR